MKCIAYLKTKLFLCLIKYCHEDVCESGGIAPPFLTLALDAGELSTSHPCRFTPRKETTATHWTGGWVGPRGVRQKD
jgi:hypothetical protein